MVRALGLALLAFCQWAGGCSRLSLGRLSAAVSECQLFLVFRPAVCPFHIEHAWLHLLNKSEGYLCLQHWLLRVCIEPNCPRLSRTKTAQKFQLNNKSFRLFLQRLNGTLKPPGTCLLLLQAQIMVSVWVLWPCFPLVVQFCIMAWKCGNPCSYHELICMLASCPALSFSIFVSVTVNLLFIVTRSHAVGANKAGMCRNLGGSPSMLRGVFLSDGLIFSKKQNDTSDLRLRYQSIRAMKSALGWVKLKKHCFV